jgi:hypothetical protein
MNPLEIQQQMAAARVAAKKVRRAASVATADAWMLAIVAVPSLAAGLIDRGLSGILIGAALCAIACVEFSGAKRIRRLDPSATRFLGFNQLALAAVLIIYSLWSLHQAMHGGLAAELKEHEAELQAMGKEMEDMLQTTTNLVYYTLIAVAVFMQGGTALYYFSREKHIRQYVETTPPWIVEMQRNGAPL